MGESSGVRNTRIKSRDKEDRISELPDSIIQHILSLFPSTREAVRTGILSKRWRTQWTHVPVLIFEPLHHSGDAYFRFIENTLMLHYSQRIKKFHLQYDYESADDPQFTAKICFAIRKCVEELILVCHCPRKSNLLPISLFDNASLVRLEMVNCCFKPKWRVNWPSLKSLKIAFDSDNAKYNCSKGIGNVVSGCPLLECFEFNGYMLDGVAIASYSLKVLSFVDAKVPETLKISCPNLVEFNVIVKNWDIPYTDKMIKNVLLGSPVIHSLKLVGCIGFDKLVIASKALKVLHLEYNEAEMIEVSCPNLEKFDMLSSGEEEYVKVANLPSSVCATLDIQGWGSDDMLKELLELFQHVNELTLGRLFFRYVSEDDDVIKILPQLNNKCLTLDVGEFILAIPGIAYALHSLRLETLVIRFTSNFSEMEDEELQNLRMYSSGYWNTHGSPSLSCLVSHLKTVEIIGLHETDDKCKFELEFIEFILKNAQVLNKMAVSLQNSRKGFVIEFSQKLLSFPRFSQCANVELLHST